MIVCYDGDGRITNVYNDPLPDGLSAYLSTQNVDHLEADTQPVSVLFLNSFVQSGALVGRPMVDCEIKIDGNAVVLAPVPMGTDAKLIFDAATSLETEFSLTEQAGKIQFQLEEPSSLKLIVTPPWPYQEVQYDIDFENIGGEG